MAQTHSEPKAVPNEEVTHEGWEEELYEGLGNFLPTQYDPSQLRLDGGQEAIVALARVKERLEPHLDMYLNELHVLTSADVASPIQRRLKTAERDVQALLALHSKDMVAQAVENARSISEEQKQYLDETMA
ncbi:uncharacterized protein A4U43_C05F8860 [Asparagus officinalis]|uniref:Uncharacterized protein n=1 Tax=Asparagus officinalis TaxID=4686 RepID=A0A5P1EQB5_ASPOF|nr:uncharacterized protein A4U43_C05F8860 [Asparagus officinalis]